MHFIFNNSFLFNPDTQQLCLFDQAESAVTLSAPSARLLQEFIHHNGQDLSRDALIKHVWEDYGFTPSGNNLNKSISEIRRGIESLGISCQPIVTIPKYGFRFEAEISCLADESGEKKQPAVPFGEETEHHNNASTHFKPLGRYIKLLLLLGVIFSLGVGIRAVFTRHTLPVSSLISAAGHIDKCRLWLSYNHDSSTGWKSLRTLLAANGIDCQRRDYDVFYSRARFTISEANEIFIGVCPLTGVELCKSIRYKSGAEK